MYCLVIVSFVLIKLCLFTFLYIIETHDEKRGFLNFYSQKMY